MLIPAIRPQKIRKPWFQQGAAVFYMLEKEIAGAILGI